MVESASVHLSYYIRESLEAALSVILGVPSQGGLAQLARAPALQAGGHRFESDILHHFKLVH